MTKGKHCKRTIL